MAHIAVECLRCNHCSLLSEAALPDYGVKPDAPIASFVQRLTCVACGSKSVRAYRSEKGRQEIFQSSGRCGPR